MCSESKKKRRHPTQGGVGRGRKGCVECSDNKQGGRTRSAFRYWGKEDGGIMCQDLFRYRGKEEAWIMYIYMCSDTGEGRIRKGFVQIPRKGTRKDNSRRLGYHQPSLCRSIFSPGAIQLIPVQV